MTVVTCKHDVSHAQGMAFVGLCFLLAQAALAGDVGLRRWTDRLIPLPHDMEVRVRDGWR